MININNDIFFIGLDLDKDLVKNGEISDIQVINRSIESILSTEYGERIFNPSYGSSFKKMLHEKLSKNNAELILNNAIDSIKKWEDRIIIIESKCKIIVNLSENSIMLYIPYIIKKSKVSSTFNKKVSLT